jgi:hypothetical protein
MLVWNERRAAPGFMQDYDDAIARYAPEKGRIEEDSIARLFEGGAWRKVVLANDQRLDAAGLRGRLASSSYAPPPGTREFDAVMHAMDELFARHQRGGSVQILYDTLVFYGKLP